MHAGAEPSESAGACSAADAAAGPTATDDSAHVVRRYLVAVHGGDAAAVADTCTEDIVMVTAEEVIVGRAAFREACERMFSGMLAPGTWTRTVHDLSVHGDNAAMQRVTALIAQGAREVLPVLVREACTALPADSVTLVHFAGPQRQTMARYPHANEDMPTNEPLASNNLAAEILSRGIAAGVREIRPMAGPRSRSVGTAPKGMRVAVPVMTGRVMWGSLWAALSQGDFAEGAVERLKTYGDLAGIAVLAGSNPLLAPDD